MTRVVVVGIGNRFRGDDAAGPEVARLVDARAPGVTAVEQDGEATRLIDAWSDADVCYVVDAIRTDSAPGTIHRLDVDGGSLDDHRARASSHGIALGDAVDLARALERLPGRLVLIGIEGVAFEHGEPMSGAVAVAVEEVARAILREISDT